MLWLNIIVIFFLNVESIFIKFDKDVTLNYNQIEYLQSIYNCQFDKTYFLNAF